LTLLGDNEKSNDVNATQVALEQPLEEENDTTTMKILVPPPEGGGDLNANRSNT
jgi:hypothetical protein